MGKYIGVDSSIVKADARSLGCSSLEYQSSVL